MKVYQKIAGTIEAYKNCDYSQAFKAGKYYATLKEIEESLPSGSGFDSGTTILLSECTPNKITLHTSYHHMNESGYYDGWTNHTIVIKPDFTNGFSMRIGGRDRNGIKEYIHQVFSVCLDEEI